MTDLIDWEKIREGNKSVFDSMFDYYYLPLCSFASIYVKDKYAVEDVVIECFGKIWEERCSLQIKSSLKNYLVTIVKNSAINYLRKNNLQIDDIEKISRLMPDEISDTLEDVGILTKLHEAINKMPEHRRRILKMAAFEEKSYSEIASELNISVNTVKTQMSRSYKFLREELNVSHNTIHFLLLI